jgi:N-acetylglucosaminyldiphosphoundecaprenol N-acetyl-beta-D-mannosaminyltransferase
VGIGRARAGGVIDRGKCNVLGVQIDALDYDAVVERVINAARERRSLTVTALAVHGVMTGVLDPVQRYRLNGLDIVTPDGMPVRWALDLVHGTRLPDRVAGPVLTLRVAEAAARAGVPIFLYGSRSTVLEALARSLCERFPGLQVAGMAPSRFRRLTPDERDEVVAQIQASKAGLVFVGLGCPRQEVWIYEYRQRLQMPLLAVGAAFDFHAGTVPRAPASLERLGLEWVFRLMREPRRLWRRYLLLNPAYMWLLALQASRLRRFDPSDSTPPSSELLYG